MKTLSDFVDKIYCINLDSRKDRWQQVSKEFDEIDILNSVERVSAVVESDPREGCLKSHLLCIKEAIDKKYENILIFEDDVCFFDKPTAVISNVIKYLDGDVKWDLFYLGGMVMYPASFVHKNVFKSRFFSTHAYIINCRAFDKILSAELPIDKWYAMNLVSYGLYPILATQREDYSDIRQKVIPNREGAFARKYELLVRPNIVIRWINYIKVHYLAK